MALLKYFKTMLPTKETGISEKATKEANATVSLLTSTQREYLKWKAYYTAFSDEQRAAIGQYAAENSNAAESLHKF